MRYAKEKRSLVALESRERLGRKMVDTSQATRVPGLKVVTVWELQEAVTRRRLREERWRRAALRGSPGGGALRKA